MIQWIIMDLYFYISQHPDIHRVQPHRPLAALAGARHPTNPGSTAGRRRSNTSAKAAANASEKTDILGPKPEEIGGFHLVQNHGLTMVQPLESDF